MVSFGRTPQIADLERLEQSVLTLYKQKTDKLLSRRRQDVFDQNDEVSPFTGKFSLYAPAVRYRKLVILFTCAERYRKLVVFFACAERYRKLVVFSACAEILRNGCRAKLIFGTLNKLCKYEYFTV